MQEEQTLQQELQTAKRITAKPMLWVSIISMIMFFAGLTSAYVISMKREDWGVHRASSFPTKWLFLRRAVLSLEDVWSLPSDRQGTIV